MTDSRKQANDYAAVNQGQLKNMATLAAAEMDIYLPGGAGDDVDNFVAQWSVPTAESSDFAPVNLGMLKMVAKHFYARLIAVGYTNAYPWNADQSTTNNYAAANIGQVKRLFSFNFALGGTANNLPDWWEMKYFGHTGVDPNALSPGGSGLTNLQDFLFDLNPTIASTMGDTFTDGWKVTHNVDPHHKVIADNFNSSLSLVVFTPLQ